MGGRSAQRKGKRGEKEFCDWLFKNLGIETERNYNQADGHSADVIIDDFIFEVKRRESLDLDSWWHQAVIAAKRHKEPLIPCVPFRQNRKPWQFLLPASLIDTEIDRGWILVNERVFLQYARGIVHG